MTGYAALIRYDGRLLFVLCPYCDRTHVHRVRQAGALELRQSKCRTGRRPYIVLVPLEPSRVVDTARCAG